MTAFVIDAFEFCRLKERRSGEVAILDLPRLAEETADQQGSIRWALEGGTDKVGHSMLTLSVSGSVQLLCQRCLSPFVAEISSVSSLILAKDEASADEIDAALDENDAFDVIVGHKALNVFELVEDEVLLSIPFSPKHEICPGQTALDEIQGAKKMSPFDVLQGLK